MQQNYAKENVSKQRKEIIAKYDSGPTKSKTNDWENPQYSMYAIIDYYGFIHDEGLTNEFLEKEDKIKKLDRKREAKWRKLLVKKQVSKSNRSSKIVGTDLFSNILNKMNESTFREEITKRIYKGIPQQFKSSIWQVFLEINAMKNSKPKVYQNMLKKALDKSPDVHQIDLDVNRTFRNTTYFKERYNNRQKALLHVLAAYSMYNTEIGYCQGMSEIAGLLLMYLVEEEDVFWGLSQLMTSSRYCMHGVFVAGFPRLLTFFTHLNNIIHKLLPKICKHFEKLEVMASSYALKWFMQCYLDRVPLTLFLRLWDIYLLEGEKLLIAMAYNILKMHKKRLIRMDHGSILQFFQTDLKKDFLYDDDLVIESLKNCIEELKRHKLSVPAPPQSNELPCRPFGTDNDFHTPSPKAVKERQIAQSNPAESIRRSLKKPRNNEQLTSNSVAKSQTPRPPDGDEIDRAMNNVNQQDIKIILKKNESITQSRESDKTNNHSIPAAIPARYRIVNRNNSKLNKSKSLHLSEEIKITDETGNTQNVSKKTIPSEGRSLIKSVPDLSNNVQEKKSKKSSLLLQANNVHVNNNHSLSSTNTSYNISIDNNNIVASPLSSSPLSPPPLSSPPLPLSSLHAPPPSPPLSNNESNHLSLSLHNKKPITKSKTTSILNSMQQSSIPRSNKRRPLSTSPETIL